MKHLRAIKYTFVWTGVAAGLLSILGQGLWSYALPVYAFGLIPLVELFLKADPSNLSQTELEMVKEDRWYDVLLYLIVPVQVGMIVLMCWKLSQPGLAPFEIVGKVWATGIGCGVLGINVAHELGHRNTWHEQLMSKILLMTSLYMHFFIEHNRGHHKHVSTPEDPASARRGEWLYTFWFRSVWGSYWSAWEIENKRMRKQGKPILLLSNEMVAYHLIQAAVVGLIAFIFGWQVMLYFLAAAVSGFLLLETVNYIEHYGLQRKKLANGSYETVMPEHSWNSDHVLGRLMLFELSRHSDHHYRSGRKFQALRHMAGSPQMPTGYPGMLVLAVIPPLWFWVMHRQIDRQNNSAASPHELATT
ncbi:MAG TPA: alkane 1-monooxygenase [Bacteroidia bacterium]|nr:alkane 1-monooxygenase [Bacteroidia bacterium]